MKLLAHLATNKLIVSTFGVISGYRKAYATLTTCFGAVEPLSAEKTNLFNGSMGKTHVIYIDHGINISEGDRLRDNSSNQIYKVVNGGVTRRTAGSMDYKQVIVEEVD